MPSSWNVEQNPKTGIRSFFRDLGNEELGFYYDSAFSGTATTIQDFEVFVTDPVLLEEENVVRTWLRLKNMFPLIACKVAENENGSATFHFDEERLRAIQSGEVEVHDIESDEDVRIFVDRLLNGPPLDCSKAVSHILALRMRNNPGQCRIIIPVAHCVTDGMANGTLVRTFCNELCFPTVRPDKGLKSMEERLSLILPLEDLYPKLQITPGRSRWRQAVAKVISQIRQSKLTGGHTLPNKLTPELMYTPADSKELFHTFSEDITTSILATCRASDITFGNALHIISQLAHARVIHRLRLQHSQNPSLEFGITYEDWEARIRQPMHFGGPLNLRPYLSPSWYQNGGATEICLSIGFWYISLPSMPFCKRPVKQWEEQFPSFDELMSRTQFKRRVDFAKRKMVQIVKSPLFLEISATRMPGRVDRTRKAAMVWRERQRNPELNLPNDPAPPVVFANGGSSLGNRDILVPSEYPLSNQDDTSARAPKLRIGRHVGHLRCRPTELYLGALMRQKKLGFFILYDGNVFDEKIVRLWMEEVKAATLHYLGTDSTQKDVEKSQSKL
ncbi:hypothetical protein SCHPADRAFT_877654 [Schizopora paradoxa]|uniref:CoA-dependent acyltransferase n=1 Tax=Schizopora paradoxa TaxID=27342 RepID=A0A0H2S1C5_9AGAM|nr:hypothetical protein SCHPADRAFT_877654 [Schizopora paradoxa]